MGAYYGGSKNFRLIKRGVLNCKSRYEEYIRILKLLISNQCLVELWPSDSNDLLDYMSHSYIDEPRFYYDEGFEECIVQCQERHGLFKGIVLTGDVLSETFYYKAGLQISLMKVLVDEFIVNKAASGDLSIQMLSWFLPFVQDNEALHYVMDEYKKAGYVEGIRLLRLHLGISISNNDNDEYQIAEVENIWGQYCSVSITTDDQDYMTGSTSSNSLLLAETSNNEEFSWQFIKDLHNNKLKVQIEHYVQTGEVFLTLQDAFHNGALVTLLMDGIEQEAFHNGGLTALLMDGQVPRLERLEYCDGPWDEKAQAQMTHFMETGEAFLTVRRNLGMVDGSDLY